MLSDEEKSTHLAKLGWVFRLICLINRFVLVCRSKLGFLVEIDLLSLLSDEEKPVLYGLSSGLNELLLADLKTEKQFVWNSSLID